MIIYVWWILSVGMCDWQDGGEGGGVKEDEGSKPFILHSWKTNIWQSGLQWELLFL